MADAKCEIQNVVLAISYRDVEFDLVELATNLEGVQYEPEVFAGLTYRMDEPKASFLIFSSGKVNSVGAHSVEDAENAIEKLTKKLRDLGVEVDEPEVEVKNIVASVNFGREFDLEQVARDFRNAEYEPEVFPGLVFRLEGTSVAFLLFVSGKCICVGAQSEKEIEEAIRRITETIE